MDPNTSPENFGVEALQEKIASLERRLAEAERRLSEPSTALRKLSRAVEQSPATIVITDVEGNIEYVNPKFTQLTGYTFDEAVGKNPRILKSGLTPPSVHRDLWETIRAGGTWQGEFCNRTKNGELYWENASISSITDDMGAITHFVAVKEDITERKRIDAALRQSEATLREYAEKLERSNRDLQEFAFVASHDLKEPLRKIMSFGSALLAGDEDLNEQQRTYIRRMHSATERMQKMVDDLLALSRVSTKGQPFVPVDLSLVVPEILSDLELQIARTGGTFEAFDLPVVDADPFQMRQLFQNLISNALKYHQPGVPPLVRVFAWPPSDGKVQVLVEDNGIGFDESCVERIFQPFQRLVGKSEYEGTGIGLAICKKIIQRHDGEITARSIPGKGSTFVITLPVKALA